MYVLYECKQVNVCKLEFLGVLNLYRLACLSLKVYRPLVLKAIRIKKIGLMKYAC